MADQAEDNGVKPAGDNQEKNKEASSGTMEEENARHRSTDAKARRRGRVEHTFHALPLRIEFTLQRGGEGEPI